MLNQTDLNNLQQRFEDHWTETQFNNVVAFIQDEFNTNKLTYTTMFGAIHHTNVAFRKHLERLVNVKFASSFGKFISQAIISATGVDVMQAYQDARDAKADRIAKQLKILGWQIVEGVPTYSDDGKTFHITWAEKNTLVQVKLGEKKVFEMAVTGYGHEWVATMIDSAVFDHL